MRDRSSTNRATNRERELARYLLARETSGDPSAKGMADATIRTFARLYVRLKDLFGSAGFEAVAKRALRLAQQEYPYLSDVVGEIQGDTYQLQGLNAIVEGRDLEDVRYGLSTMLGTFFWLLVTFVGDGLFWRFIQGVWPDITPEETGFSAKEKQG